MPILALQLQQNSHQVTHPKPGLRKLQDETVDLRFDTVRSTATVSPVCHRGSAAILVLSAVERLLICILLLRTSYIILLAKPRTRTN